MIRLQINDREITAEPGQTVLAAAQAAGIVIPTLCHHPALKPVGSCRLCLVEVEGKTSETPSCMLPVTEGMTVHTESASLTHSRRFVLELLLEQVDAPTIVVNSHNELLHWARQYQVDLLRQPASERRFVVDSDPNPVIRVDMNQCILCTRCVRACEDVQGRWVWQLVGRGHETAVVAGLGTAMLDAGCESCGLCAAVCPTGALSDRNSFGVPAPERLVTTTCGYCGVGCQFDLNVRQERVVAVTSNANAPVNGISLCVKGRYGFDFLHHPERLTTPLVRRYLLEGGQKPASQATSAWDWIDVSWEQSLELVAQKLHEIQQTSGPDTLGVLSSAKCTNEENYLIQKFARQVLRTNNVDHCARLCHSSTVAGLAMAFGSGAMSNSLADVAHQSAAMLVIGSNTTEQHPVFGAMIRQAVQQRGLKLVVADPRRIDLVDFAAVHVRQRPGSDIALINGLMHIIVQRGWQDRAFIAARCEEFDTFAGSLESFTPQRVAELTGVPAAKLEQAAEMLALHKPMAVVWAMGITQHTCGVLNVLALANLQMLLGNMGLPGGGVNPLRGQNNVQGACDMGALPNVLPGYQFVTDPLVQAQFNAAWRMGDDFALPTLLGLTVTEMIDAAGQGEVRGLYIVGEDPALTEPDLNLTRAALAKAEFIVLQEIFPSATSDYADVLLPGAAFAEKEGTFTNTERRVQLVRKAIEPPGIARADWQIIADLAQRMIRRQGLGPAGARAAWSYSSAAEVMSEAADLTPSYRGVSHQRLRQGESLQWPVLDAQHPGTPILHTQQFTRGRGRFHVTDYLPPAEVPDAEFPLLLTTGRVLYHWHGGELSRRSQPLMELCPEPIVEISLEDAARAKIQSGDSVRIASRRGSWEAIARVSERTASGVVFGNFHFPAEQNANRATHRALDPIAKIPEYKVCAVRLERIAT